MNKAPYDPFAARPIHVPHVKAEERNGQIHVQHIIPPAKGFRDFFARHFSMFPFRLVCLDEQGTFYWKQINGQRTLAEIEEQLRHKFQLQTAQSRDAVILFTKMLMQRSLIALQLPHHPRVDQEVGS